MDNPTEHAGSFGPLLRGKNRHQRDNPLSEVGRQMARKSQPGTHIFIRITVIVLQMKEYTGCHFIPPEDDLLRTLTDDVK